MPVLFDDLVLCDADGRSVIHLRSDDLPRDIAEFEYLLPLYEVVPGERSLFLISKTAVGAALEQWTGRPTLPGQGIGSQWLSRKRAGG